MADSRRDLHEGEAYISTAKAAELTGADASTIKRFARRKLAEDPQAKIRPEPLSDGRFDSVQ